MEINFILSLHENVIKNISINAFLYIIYFWATLVIGGHHLRCQRTKNRDPAVGLERMQYTDVS